MAAVKDLQPLNTIKIGLVKFFYVGTNVQHGKTQLKQVCQIKDKSKKT